MDIRNLIERISSDRRNGLEIVLSNLECDLVIDFVGAVLETVKQENGYFDRLMSVSGRTRNELLDCLASTKRSGTYEYRPQHKLPEIKWSKP